MRKTKWIAAGILATVCLLGPQLNSALAQEALKIGVPTALTGTYAGLGNEALRAIKFATEEANAKGGVDGRKVEIKVLDSEAKPEVARQQAEKLASEGYRILTGTIASGEALAMAPLLGRWDAIYVSTINKSDKLTGDSCVPRVFRVNKQDAQDAAVVRPWLATRKETRWAVLAADIAWGRDSGRSFTEAGRANNKETVAEIYAPFGSNDYAPFIQQIKSSGAEGLWVALAGRDAINFATQAHDFGILDKIFVAGVSFVTDSTVKAVGPIAKGIWGIINYSSTLDTPENKAFVAAWKKKYDGAEPTNFEGETYMGMQVIFQAVQKAKSVKPVDVAKAMSGGTFDTILGRFPIRAEDHQMVGPNFFGYIGEQDGMLRPIITITIPADVATPPPTGSCKMSNL